MNSNIKQWEHVPVTIFLGPKVDEVWSHTELLTTSELIHTEGSGGMLIGHLIPDPPPHVHHLELQSMLLLAVVLDLGVHPLHQGVPLHQHVSEGGTSENSHHLKLML